MNTSKNQKRVGLVEKENHTFSSDLNNDKLSMVDNKYNRQSEDEPITTKDDPNMQRKKISCLMKRTLRKTTNTRYFGKIYILRKLNVTITEATRRNPTKIVETRHCLKQNN